MTVSVTTLRPGRRLEPVTPEAARERTIRRRVTTVWGLLMLNAIGYSGLIVHVPSIFGKAITQASLPVALVLALSVNRRVRLRPNVFLCLATLLALEAILTSLQAQYVGTLYRTFRFAEFVTTLWLLTPFWGRRDLLLVRAHLRVLGIILGSVLLGLFVAPHKARPEGRLSGALWAIPATQVAHYAAVVIGLVIVLWFCGQLRGRPTLIIVLVSVAILLLTRTRTALVGMTAGILVAGLSLIIVKARVRRLFAIAGAIGTLAILTLSSVITTFLARGEGTTELFNLTGRTKVWGPLLATPRTTFQEIFGFGLSNSSFNGLPIDSNWLSSYQNQGLFGVTICAIMLVFLLVVAYFQPRGVERALALFLITYCVIASFTEDGFTDATPYLLELVLAASLFVRPGPARQLE